MIILNMIVKNEAHCIRRCLESVVPFIDRAVIVDTGSTDDTPELISEILGGEHSKNHMVFEHPWIDFAHNRTEAYRLAQYYGKPEDFALLMDADEELRVTKPFPRFTTDVVGMWHRTPKGGMYMRPQLLRLACDFYWEGALHEELKCKQEIQGERFTDGEIVDHFDSARNRDPDKYLKDAMFLTSRPPTPRNIFYLAQSWRDAGDLNMAYTCYQKRALMGGNPEEVWYSMFMLGCILKHQHAPCIMTFEAFRRAFEFRPQRAETLREWAKCAEEEGMPKLLRNLTAKADQIPMTTDTLFVDPRAYKYAAVRA